MSIRNLLLVLALNSLVVSVNAQELVWSYEADGGYVDTSPAIGDLDGDGNDDVVVATTAGSVVAMDGQGHVIWEQAIRGPITIPPTLADLDSGPSVLVLNKWGQLVCFDAARGAPLWNSELLSKIEWGTTAIVADDLDGDGHVDIVAGDNEGHVRCFSDTGAVVWTYEGDYGWTLCPATADLDGDGGHEILVAGTERPLVCLGNDGKERWRVDLDVNGASPVIADLTNDGTPEIVTGMDSDLAAVDATGNVLWRVPMKRPIDSAITVADFDNDGTMEILAVDLAGTLLCAGPDGKERWSGNVEERARRSPTVGDIDGDGTVEILVAGYSGAVHVFAPDGHLIQRFPLGAASNASATLCVLDDGHLSMVCPTVAGTMQVYQWPDSQTDANLPWPEYRLSSQRTSSVVMSQKQPQAEFTTIDTGALYAGTNRFVVEVANPAHQSLEVRLEVLLDDVAPSTAFVISSDPAIELQIPYVIPSEEAINVTFKATVTSSARTLLRREQKAYIVPFQKELADAGALLDEIESALPLLADSRGVDGRDALLRSQLEDHRDRAASVGTTTDVERRAFRDALHAYVDDVSQLHALVLAAANAQEQGGSSILLSAANPWAPFGAVDEVDEGRLKDATLAISAFSGETESAALNVYNFTNATKVFRVVPGPLTGPNGEVPARDVLVLRETVDVPTDLMDMSADALPKLNQGSLLRVAPWSARQLWITLRGGSLTPGAWGGAISLKSLDVDPVELEAPLHIQVWPQAIAKDDLPAFCQWGYVHSSVLKDQPEGALDDQVAHGTNVFVGLFYPQATYDEAGTIVGDIDFTAHDEYVKRHAPYGKILFFNYQNALKGPDGQDSEAYGKAHVAWLRAWVEHLKSLGVGYDGFALYPVDEPGLNDGLVERYLRMAKLAREADPRIALYTDPVARITMEELQSMAPYVDIWCPNRNGFLLNENADKLAFIQSTEGAVWTYECEGNAKHQSPLGYYRGLSWLAWHHGLSGVGFWTYCTSQFDPWFRPTKQHDYLLIYQGDGVVTSKRWEAARDGVEDFAMLRLLKRAADDAEKAGRAPDAVKEARALLNERAEALAQFCGLDKAGTLPGKEGARGVRETADTRWNAVQAIRQDMADVLQRLEAK